MTAKQKTEAAFHQLAQVMRDLEGDLGWRLKDSPRIPTAWHEIAQERIQPLKRPVTLRVDEDVIKSFRAMGQGHLTRMNAVLRTFMLARLAEVVKAQEEYKPPPEEEKLSEEDRLFAAFVQWVGKQGLSEDAKVDILMRYLELESAVKEAGSGR